MLAILRGAKEGFQERVVTFAGRLRLAVVLGGIEEKKEVRD